MYSSLLLGVELLIAFFIKDVHNIKLTYKWYANVTAGSLLPNEHLSHYRTIANLTIYVTDQDHIFQIEDVSLSQDLSVLPFKTINNSMLSLPFKVMYNNDDIKFFGHEADEIWSLNMKKSVATLFQLKKSAYVEGAFATVENNTFGTCDVEYITTKKKSLTTVLKIINEASCSNSPNTRRSNTPFFVCPSAFQEGVASHNERMYMLLESQNPYISEIVAIGTIHFQPFQALAEAHHIQVSQFLKLISVEDEISLKDLKSLKNVSSIIHSTELIQVPTFGRFPENKTLLKAEIYQLLGNLTDSLDWKLSTSNLDNQTSFQILELMWGLDVEDWQELYQMVSLGTSYSQETIQHFFWDFMPQVGSEASVIFIKNLITSKKISGFSASLLLTTFPLYLRQVSEKFLIESEDFLRLKDVDEEVQNAGILSFAVLVQRVCSQYCTKELLDRYTKYCLDKFMETPNYQDQMVYLQALSNMQLSRILDFLTPIITDPSYDRHIRCLAIWSMLPTIEKHPVKATEIFWPIFVNSSESLDIRVSALYILIITQPTASRLLTFFWHMKEEPNYHVYNFFYTTIHSFANTKYPCYNETRRVASQLSRYLLPKVYRWATGNYIIDYEDSVRGYGGVMQLFIVSSEKTGLPSTFVLSTEQHSHGLSSKFSIHVKFEGIVNTVWKTLFDSVNSNTANFFTAIDLNRFLQDANFSVNTPELVHAEFIVKIDGNTVFCQFYNETTFTDVLLYLERASALYYEFSVNYQRVRFPSRYEVMKLSDLGTPVTLQIRTASVLSLRGSIKQSEKGARRNAVLDFRYSMNTVTTLKTLNTLNKYWYGTDRTRSLHVRVPFSTHLFEKQKRSFFEITADRHKDFANDSRLGIVWHSTIKLLPELRKSQPTPNNGNNGHHWSIESRDLGARFDAKMFDCQGGNNMVESLDIIKEAFQLSNKNYKMVIGGVPILGFFSFANYFTFIPPGDSCGVIVTMTPLQVQLALVSEGKPFHIIMRTEKEKHQIWDLIVKNRDIENDGLTQMDFKLEHPEAEKNVTITNSGRLMQFEGYIIAPSFRQGILNAPSPVKGQAWFSWGSAEQITSVELSLRSDNTADNWPVNCENDTALCWQTVSNLATKQTIHLNCTNLPIWTTTALLSIFPDNVHADKTSTKIQFSLPAKLPWTTQGECVISSNRVLNFDNGTIRNFQQQSHCYSIAVADCSSPSQFIVGLRKSKTNDNTLELKVIIPYTVLSVAVFKEDAERSLVVNNTRFIIENHYSFYPPQSNASNCMFQFKYWEKSKMTEVVVGQGELILQYYGESVVAIASFKLRGRMCGLCGDFNGEISNDDPNLITSCVEDFLV